MPRPCARDHPPSPGSCPLCRWCADPSPKGAAHRRFWGEPEPTPGRRGRTTTKPRVPLGCRACHQPKETPMNCGDARQSMTAAEMADLIRKAPPGPWPDGWAGWGCVRDAHLILMRERIAAPPPPATWTEDAGIVSCVSAKPGVSSGKDLPQGYFPGAWAMVKELRRHGCTLPVTFFHLGALEWDPALTRLVAPLGVSVVDLREVEARAPRRPRILAGWEAKAYAMVYAPYKQALYLDADNLPLRDPTFLFSCSQQKFYGSVWWPDVPPYDRSEWLPACVWANVGMSYCDEVDFETGQFIVDRSRCWRELDLAMWMNEHSDYFYRFVFGDKSTFHLAWRVLGTNYAMPQALPGGNPASLLQRDLKGADLFQHCTRNKPSLSGFPSPGALVHREACEAHVAGLRSLWNGRLWEREWRADAEGPASETVQERKWRWALEGAVFAYERQGLGSRPLRLLEDGRVGRGLAKMEVSWSVWESGGGPLLVVSDLDGCPTMTLRPDDGDVGGTTWRGRWLQHERCPVVLTPEEAKVAA